MTTQAGRILLIHPLGYASERAGGDISRLANIMPPLGLASMAAYLERAGFRADIIDCFAWPDSDRRIDRYVRTHRPAMVGVSCTTSGFLDAVRILRRVRRLSPGTRTVVGGPHVSALRERVLEDFPGIDFAVVGEGERPIRALLASGGRVPADVPGLVYRDDGAVRFTGFQDLALKLDELPFPAYDKLAGFPGRYQLPIFSYPQTPSVSCISSRGCPFQCSYCDRSVFRRGFRYNSAEYLFEHLRHLRKRFGVRHVNFYDDHFTCNRQRVVEFCRRMIDARSGMTFNCAVRAEHVDRELLRLMRRAGCWMISLGVETGAPELLAQHRQNVDLDLTAEVIRWIHAAGIRVKALLMIGLPGETEQTFRRSMEYVWSLPIDDVNLARFTPFPGSPLYERIHELGRFDEDWEKMDCMSTVFVPHGLTRERYEELFLHFYQTWFRRPRVLWNYASMLWKSPDSWRRFVSHAGSFLGFALSRKRIRETRA